MFCSNCGKELPSGTIFCDSCGMMLQQQEPVYTDAFRAEPDTSQKKLPSKNVVIGIGIASAVIIVLCVFMNLVASAIGSLHNHHRDSFNVYDYPDSSYFGGRGGYGSYDYDNDSRYPGFGGKSSSTPKVTASPAQDDGSLPPDSNGNTYDNPNYEWPTTDGTYEFYAKSTIPKFESVTGQSCIDSVTDEEGYTYYKYKLDNDALSSYINAIKDAGYTQTDFDVQGKDSFERYENGVQYLDKYVMNSDGEIVIMA